MKQILIPATKLNFKSSWLTVACAHSILAFIKLHVSLPGLTNLLMQTLLLGCPSSQAVPNRHSPSKWYSLNCDFTHGEWSRPEAAFTWARNLMKKFGITHVRLQEILWMFLQWGTFIHLSMRVLLKQETNAPHHTSFVIIYMASEGRFSAWMLNLAERFSIHAECFSAFRTEKDWLRWKDAVRSLIIMTLIKHTQRCLLCAILPIRSLYKHSPFISHSVWHIWWISFSWSPCQNHIKILWQ